MPHTEWAVDGTPLTDLAWDPRRIDSSVGPPMRGSDRRFAGLPGATFSGRVADSYSVTLGMWIMGQDGGGAGADEWIIEHERRHRLLRRLFRPDTNRQIALSKTWTDDLGTHTATAMGTADEEPRVEHRKPWISKLTWDVYLPDPFFYGPEVSVPIEIGATVPIVNSGDEPTTAILVDFYGTLGNPVVTNLTPSPDVWMKVGSAIALGDHVVADVESTTITRASDDANLIGAVTHSGARPWFGLLRGTNNVRLTVDSGTDGHAAIRYREKWM